MYTRRSRILLVCAILIVTSLACNLSAGKPAAPTLAEPTAQNAPTEVEKESPPEPTHTSAPTAVPALKAALGDEYRSTEGGYAFYKIPDYKVEEIFGITTLKAPDADPDTGPLIALVGGTNTESKTNEQFYEEIKAQTDAVTIENQRAVQIGGLPGIAADLTGVYAGKEISGRMVVAMVSPLQQFSMLASAPTDRWKGELEPLFEAVLATITFFEAQPIDIGLPEETPTTEAIGESVAETPTAPPTGAGGELRQWASSASAGSSFADPSWAAVQATGAPDTPECGDYSTAWASASWDAVEWLEVRFTTPVIPTEVVIYQSYNPSQVVKVELLDTTGDYQVIYVAEPAGMTVCPSLQTLLIPGGFDRLVDGVRITVDQSVLGLGWNEIDAVELVGTPGEGSAPPVVQGATVEPNSGLPILPDAEQVYAEATLVNYWTKTDRLAVRDFYLEQLPKAGWLLDVDEKGKCRDNDRCMGWHQSYADPNTTTFFFLQGEHAYLTMNLIEESGRVNVILLIDPEFE